MPCYHPIKGWRGRDKNPETGKRPIVFDRRLSYQGIQVEFPCGRCIGCRLERSRQWAMRCVHEASMYSDNCFITLTYNNQNLPKDRSLHLEHFQLFMKRLRKKYGTKIKFFHCGEYGQKHRRPHYHACLFNFDFKDRKLWKTKNGFKVYVSKSLETLWPFGFSTVGDVTFESAAYVARYITKKINGEAAEKNRPVIDPDTGIQGALKHYETVNFKTGEVWNLKPEYTTMSRRPGIGKSFYQKFKNDIFPSDEIIMRGKKMGVPKYYDSLLESENPDELKRIKNERKAKAREHEENNAPDRLKVREKKKLKDFTKLIRSLESEI